MMGWGQRNPTQFAAPIFPRNYGETSELRARLKNLLQAMSYLEIRLLLFRT